MGKSKQQILYRPHAPASVKVRFAFMLLLLAAAARVNMGDLESGSGEDGVDSEDASSACRPRGSASPASSLPRDVSLTSPLSDVA